jgi:hypothetical protein
MDSRGFQVDLSEEPIYLLADYVGAVSYGTESATISSFDPASHRGNDLALMQGDRFFCGRFAGSSLANIWTFGLFGLGQAVASGDRTAIGESIGGLLWVPVTYEL